MMFHYFIQLRNYLNYLLYFSKYFDTKQENKCLAIRNSYYIFFLLIGSLICKCLSINLKFLVSDSTSFTNFSKS